MPVEKQVVSIFLGTNGYLNSLGIQDVKNFEKEIHEYINLKYPQIFNSIKETKELKNETIELIKKAANEFLNIYKKDSLKK